MHRPNLRFEVDIPDPNRTLELERDSLAQVRVGEFLFLPDRVDAYYPCFARVEARTINKVEVDKALS